MSTGIQRWIMHLDMDAFYAAVEQRDDHRLRDRPVVVGAQPGGRGVVATCSYEARVFGIHSAMPINEAYRRCPHAAFIRPRMAHYAAVARQIREVMAAYSPLVEPASIDEAYLDVSGLDRLIGPPETIGRRIKADIRAAAGLTASVGIGPNRLVAKIASEVAKPDGLTVIPAEQVLDFLGVQPAGVLRGLGAKTLPKLARLGIDTVANLRDLSLEQLQALVGARSAVNLYQQARGIASDRVGGGPGRQSLSKETTFASDVTDRRRLRDTLAELAAGVARQARREGLAGRIVVLKVRFQGFETHTRQQRLSHPSQDDRILRATAWSLYENLNSVGKAVRLVGLGFSELGPPHPVQGDLFDGGPNRTLDSDRDRNLNLTLDRINARFGSGALRRGGIRGSSSS